MGVGDWAAGLVADLVLSCTAVLVFEMDGTAAFEMDGTAVAAVCVGVAASLVRSFVLLGATSGRASLDGEVCLKDEAGAGEGEGGDGSEVKWARSAVAVASGR
eukprot:1554761-Pleurochrysis_carterae.AAC.1